MLTIIILSIGTIFFATIVIIDLCRGLFCDDFLGFFSFICLLVNGLSLIVALCSLININYDFDIVKENYHNLQDQVAVYNADTTHTQVEAYSLRNDVLDMNNTISKHKVYSHSPWTNCWYSKDIGNLDKIQLK